VIESKLPSLTTDIGKPLTMLSMAAAASWNIEVEKKLMTLT